MLPDPPEPAGNNPEKAEQRARARALHADCAPFTDQLQIPQFGINHLLAWTTLTAALLGIFLWHSPAASLGTAADHGALMDRLFAAASAIMAAGGLVGTFSVLRARCYKKPERLQPGHWLVLIITFQSMLSLAVWLVALVLPHGASNWVRAIAVPSRAALLAVAFGLAVRHLRDDQRWKNLFEALAFFNAIFAILAVVAITVNRSTLSQALPPPQFAVFATSICCWPVLLPWAIIVVLRDWPRRAHRDWVHGLGAVLLCLSYGILLVLGAIEAVLP